MVSELMSRIDLTELEQALLDVRATIPSVITPDDTNFHAFNALAKISLVQINYNESGDYSIGKIYVNINPETEISFHADYTFRALNFYRKSEDHVIYSYDTQDHIIAEYQINREVWNNDTGEVYMIKSTGNVYQPPYRVSECSLVESLRISWGSLLLCYSLKQDGRISFYIMVNHELPVQVSGSQFR